jgi:D-alanyl-D-alanine carboxypeptidase
VAHRFHRGVDFRVLRPLSLATLLFLLLTSSVMAHAPRSTAIQARAFPAPPIHARAGVVMDALTGQVLASVNPHLRLPMASTTKIMTALLAVMHGKLSDRITVPATAFNFEADATVMGLKPGMVVTLQQLLYGLLLPSGADAANTIAIHYGTTEAGFVAMMNAEAKALGMVDTHYVNAHGLTAPNHYTSAFDLATLGRFVSGIPAIMKVVDTKYYNWNGRTLTNVNAPLFWYPGLDGIKPGFTDDAGLCQVLDAQRHGRHVVVALLNTPNLDYDARNYLNFGLRDFTWVQSKMPGDGPTLVQSGVDASGAYEYFPSSGHYVHGRFLAKFAALGGAAVLGYPRTEPITQGATRVQFFQNGAISQNLTTGIFSRLALGLTPAPTPPTATPGPSPSPTATPLPRETSIALPGDGTATPGQTSSPTPHPGTTPTPTAHPKPAPRPILHPAVASALSPYFRKHTALLGAPAGAPYHIGPRIVQLFAYGALDYNTSNHHLALLPIGDRLLAARGYLPLYPGNTYPANFATRDVLQAIGWLSPITTRRQK